MNESGPHKQIDDDYWDKIGAIGEAGKGDQVKITYSD